MAAVPLGDGSTLMLPTEAADSSTASMVDLDDEAKTRLLALRSQIDSMLQLKDA